jgi:pimeloyl-ACP methyl ester carboxylesterase
VQPSPPLGSNAAPAAPNANQPPAGRLLEIDGVRLHVVEQGEGPAVVLIHGNMVSERDYEASGLLTAWRAITASSRSIVPALATAPGRAIASGRPQPGEIAPRGDRPARRPDRRSSSAIRWARWSRSALALDYPEDVRRLVLLGGYYYPSARIDALLTAPVALPVLGDVMRYTVTAISARLMLNRLVQAMFAPKGSARAGSSRPCRAR